MEQKIKLQQASDITGIDVSTLSKIELGKRVPTAEQLLSLTKLYKCDYSKLKLLKLKQEILNSISTLNADEKQHLLKECLKDLVNSESSLVYTSSDKAPQKD